MLIFFWCYRVECPLGMRGDRRLRRGRRWRRSTPERMTPMRRRQVHGVMHTRMQTRRRTQGREHGRPGRRQIKVTRTLFLIHLFVLGVATEGCVPVMAAMPESLLHPHGPWRCRPETKPRVGRFICDVSSVGADPFQIPVFHSMRTEFNDCRSLQSAMLSDAQVSALLIHSLIAWPSRWQAWQRVGGVGSCSCLPHRRLPSCVLLRGPCAQPCPAHCVQVP